MKFSDQIGACYAFPFYYLKAHTNYFSIILLSWWANNTFLHHAGPKPRTEIAASSLGLERIMSPVPQLFSPIYHISTGERNDSKRPTRKRKDPTADTEDSPSGRSSSFRAPRPISRPACDFLAWCAERSRQQLSTGGGISCRQSPPSPVRSRMREKPRSAPLRTCCRSSSVYLLGSFFGFRSRISICRVVTIQISVEQRGRRVKRA